MEKELNLNLGGGKFWKMNSWVNLEQELGYDLSKNLLSQIIDDSVSKIYTSHCLEHIPPPTMFRLVKDCRRVLKQNGILRIVMPDCEKFINALINGERKGALEDYKLFAKTRYEYVINMGGNTKGLDLPSPYGHFFFWTVHNLCWVLLAVGFTDIHIQDFGKSVDPVFETIAVLGVNPNNPQPVSGFDNPRQRSHSFYIEAVKS